MTEKEKMLVSKAFDVAIDACKRQQEVFLTPEYATGQPLSSLAERFACGRCVEEIEKEKSRLLGD